MKGLGRYVSRNYIAVLIVSAVLLVFSLFSMSLTKVNYDILSYLPGELNSVKGEEILDETFRTAGSALAMVDITDVHRVEKLKEKIEEIEGVEEVTWYGSISDTHIPLSYIPENLKNQFMKGNLTLMKIRFRQAASTSETYSAIEKIKELLDDQEYLGGVAALVNDLKHLVDHEKTVYILVAVILILIILGIALDSFAIPVIFLVSIGAAIAFNMGTNFMRKDISYITSSIAAVLQLGVTMDFSIFLYHRFEEERKKNSNKFEAMEKAISSTSVAIAASSLTTVAGFLAMVPMKIKLGEDMGFVLAKGVVIGVIVALTVLPALLLMFDDIIHKSGHKPLMPGFGRSSEFLTKNYKVIFVVFLVLFIPAYYGKVNTEIYYNVMDAIPSHIKSMESTEEIKNKFNISEIVYLIENKSVDRSVEENFRNDVENIPNVKDTQCIASFADSAIPDSFIPEKLRNEFEAGNYRYISINLTTKAAEDETNNTIDMIHTAAKKYFGDDYYLTGEAVMTKDLIKMVDGDIKVVNLISIAAVFVILMLSLKSLTLPVLLVGVIQLAIFFNLGIPYYTGTSMPFVASITIGSIQLGTTVDYSILLVTRYMEELRNGGGDKLQAMKNTIKGTGPSILTSALTLAATTLGVGAISKVNMIGQFAAMIGRGTIISFICILFALPSVLLICDALIRHTTIGWEGAGKSANKYEKSLNV